MVPGRQNLGHQAEEMDRVPEAAGKDLSSWVRDKAS